MGWGVHYKHSGYLSRLTIASLEDKLEELRKVNDLLWREILAYMASTPPQTAKDSEGSEYPWQEFIAVDVAQKRETIEENMLLIARIEDCLDVLREKPEDVKEG